MKKILFLSALIMLSANVICFADEGTCPMQPIFESQKAQSSADTSVSEKTLASTEKQTNMENERHKSKKHHKKRWWQK